MKNAKKITYESFTERVAKRASVSEVDANAYIHQLSETMGEALEEGDEVQLYRFGRFVTQHVDERSGHNPGTGESITIPEHTRVDFHPYQALLTAVNWPFRHLKTRMLLENELDKKNQDWAWLLLFLGLLMMVLLILGLGAWIWHWNDDSGEAITPPVALEAPGIQFKKGVKPEASITQVESVKAVSKPDKTRLASPVKRIVVNKGDTLWGIALSQWNDASWWPLIYAENRKVMTPGNPDFIDTGSFLRIPNLKGSVVAPSNADLISKTEAYGFVAEDYSRLSHMRASEYRLVAERGFGELAPESQ